MISLISSSFTRKLGTFGDVGFFSLGRGKALSTIEGGVILTDRDDIADKLKLHMETFPCYGFSRTAALVLQALVLMLFLHPLLFWLPRSMPFLKLGETLYDPHFPIFRMSPFQAGLAINWRFKLRKLRDLRKKNVKKWISALEARESQGLNFDNRRPSGLIRFPLRLSDVNKRELILRNRAARSLGIMQVYPDSIDGITGLEGCLKEHRFPVAKSYEKQLVTLPTHGYVTQRDIEKINTILESFSAFD
jgi:dTDP-4-amino-4,6-dideoxygalactose transaminase